MMDSMTVMRRTALALLMVLAFFVGTRVNLSRVNDARAVYDSGWYDAAFFDGAYSRSNAQPVQNVQSALVAHHLLVADKIAEVFAMIANDDVKTVVLVSPNHFSRGIYAAQVSKGAWETPFGIVESDADAVDALLAADATLRHSEEPFNEEHGLYGLMPFVARSFPNARVVAVTVREGLSPDAARGLGETIARTLPDAMLVASVDMTHYRDAEYTAANDANVLAALTEGALTENLDIDSNTSLRILFGFNAARSTTSWHLTHHGSSLAMGAARDASENTSHILGYFTGWE